MIQPPGVDGFRYNYSDWASDKPGGQKPSWGLEMGGAGVGLPTVRQYAQYFGGDLTFQRW